jgi:UDP-N-acetylmuramate-alanine ligase
VERGLPLLLFPKALSEMFLASRHPVVVAGTHGKTTTTSLLAWLLQSAGRDPGLLVGGIARNFGASFRLGRGEAFGRARSGRFPQRPAPRRLEDSRSRPLPAGNRLPL